MERLQLSFDISALTGEQLQSLTLHLFALMETQRIAIAAFIRNSAGANARSIQDFQDIAANIEPLAQQMPATAQDAVKAWAKALADSTLRTGEQQINLCSNLCIVLNECLDQSAAEINQIVGTAVPGNSPQVEGKMARKRRARPRPRGREVVH